ncbi:RNA polymerase sigma-70 factor [Pedobacter caeni]|uniref:RNA polymerase sigma-70 factor, ECF subfamily n=1 Tax=Pedobacter caeni TaxID=288992 RepID=A0A1M4VYL4_9SPHI|nr:RNA polymerase sigma-70 factor [Pedobacter caeni]SHE74101.1 RNA polymerase sigma-70 factor, ECF subfamily [Pedobacter caeni]
MLKPVRNESDLLNKVALGDEKAFEELFMAYHQQLGEYVLMLTQSQEMTEEIVQDVFLKVWLNRSGIKNIDKFTGYLFILTRNYCLNAIRKIATEHKRQERYYQQAEEEEQLESAGMQEEQDFQSLIDQAIAQLPPQQQKVFTCRLKGLKNPEIAAQMNISTDSVKKYQQWALKSVIGYVKSCEILSALLILISQLEKY